MKLFLFRVLQVSSLSVLSAGRWNLHEDTCVVTKARSFTGDRAKRRMGMKTRLARSLGGFCRS